MLTKAVRLHGANDLRLGTIELPEIKDDEILVKVISDSLCMSSYKAASQGSNHKRVPNDIAENPIIVGHEFCGVIEKVGAKWADQFTPGQRFAITALSRSARSMRSTSTLARPFLNHSTAKYGQRAWRASNPLMQAW